MQFAHPSFFPRFLMSAIAWFAVAGLAANAQERLPMADDVKALQAKFKAERDAAVDQKFPPPRLESADALAKRASVALEGNSFRESLRLYREARWQLPYFPPDLPKGVSRVFGSSRMRHGDTINQIAFSADGTKLASASEDGTVKIWDLGNGRELRTLKQDQGPMRTVAWSNDGKLLASAGGDLTADKSANNNDIQLWNPETGQVKHILKGHRAHVRSVAFRPDSKTLVSGSDDKTIRIWDVEKGTELQTVNKNQENASINWVIYSSNGKLIASTNNDGQLQVWKPDAAPPQQKLVHGLGAHSGGAYQVVFSPDMKTLYTCGDKTARQWGGTGPIGENISGTGARQKFFDAAAGGHAERVAAIALSPDGRTLVTGSMDKSIRVWDLNTGKVVRTLQGHTEEITSLAFNKDGALLASASADQSIRIWNLSSADEHRNFVGNEGYVWSAVFSNDGKLFASAGADRAIVIRDTITGEVVKKIPAHSLAVTAIVFNPDGTQILSAGGDRLVKLWNVKSGELIKEFKGHTSAVMALALSADGKRILSGGADKMAILWDVEKGTAIHTFSDTHSPISSVAIRKDGKQAVIGGADGLIHVFDISASPKESSVASAHLSGVGAVTYSSDGARLATCGGDKLVKVWKVADNGTLTLAHEFKGHSGPVSSAAFSNDGRLLASGGGDFIVKVWDVQNGTELRSLRGHTDWVSSVMFGSDSRFILSASVDKSVKIWELSNEETVPTVGHSREVKSLAVSANGKLLASGSKDRTIKIWDIDGGQELYTLSEHTGEVNAVAFDPTGQRLVSGGDDGKILIWDLKSKKVAQSIDCNGNVAVIAFTAKGDKFLVWYYRRGIKDQTANTMQVYDRGGKPLHSLTVADTEVKCLVFSADCEWAALGSSAGSAQIWDIGKSERIGGDLPVHQNGLGDLVFTPDKKQLVTGDEEGEIKIWNLAKKEAIKTFSAHKNGLIGISMSPDGKRFVTLGRRGEIRLWDTHTGEKVKEWVVAAPIRNITFTPDSKKLITANADTTLDLFELPE